MNYAQLRVFDTVTLGWVAGAHPSFSIRDEMKERFGKLMKGEHTNLQYALFPWSFHYITDKNKRLTTRGITIQIMKSDNISPAKFREDMVQQWQRTEEESGNPLGGQYFVPVGRGADLGTNTMTNIFHKQNQFLRKTKMKLVHNLGEMDEGLDIDLNDHVDIPHENITLHNILRSFQVKNNQVILMVDKTNTIGTYRFLYNENMEKYMVDLLSNIDDHTKDSGDWSACDNHYRFNSGEKVTPDDVMRSEGNSSFWKSYADGISAGPILTETRVYLTKPPPRRPITIASYAAGVQRQSTTGDIQNNQSVDAATTVSTISGDSGEPRNEAGIDDLKRKLADIDTHRDNYAKQQQKVEDDVSTLTESMHKMASDIINIRKDMNGLSSQVKEITELLKQQIEIKTASNFIKSPPRQRRRTGNIGSGSLSSNDDTKRTWVSDCDSGPRGNRQSWRHLDEVGRSASRAPGNKPGQRDEREYLE
jgi:hypothetical protein